MQHKVSFRLGDCSKLDRHEYYDAIYSRDVFLHIEEKHKLFSVLRAALKQNGRLLFTDYCCGSKPWRHDFEDYVAQRQYHLLTTEEYISVLTEAGFRSVTGEDITGRFIEILEKELERISRLDLDRPTQEKLGAAWRQKIDRAETGDQRWGLFSAVK